MYDEFIAVISEMTKVFTNLIQVERRKLRASLDNDMDTLKSCMAKEQAASMELKGLERKRIDIQTSLGMQDLSFREMVDKAGPDYEYELSTSLNLLSNAMTDFENMSDEARTVVEMNIANLNMLLASRKEEELQATSQNNSMKKGSGGKFTDFKA